MRLCSADSLPASVVANCRRFGDMLAAFPALWACDKKSPDELLEDIRKQIQAFGNAHGWARMGPNGQYLRPHVVRKLWFLLNSVQGIQQSDVEWQHWSLAKLRDLFPDMRGFVNNAPRHRTDIRLFNAMAPEVPLSMHSCWTCLVGLCDQRQVLRQSAGIRQSREQIYCRGVRTRDSGFRPCSD